MTAAPFANLVRTTLLGGAFLCLLTTLCPRLPAQFAETPSPKIGSYLTGARLDSECTLTHTGGDVPQMNWDGEYATVTLGAAVAKVRLQAPILVEGMLVWNDNHEFPGGYQVWSQSVHAAPGGHQVTATLSSQTVADPDVSTSYISFGFGALDSFYDSTGEASPTPVVIQETVDELGSSTFDPETSILTLNASAEFTCGDVVSAQFLQATVTAAFKVRYRLKIKECIKLRPGGDVSVVIGDGPGDILPVDSEVVIVPGDRVITGPDSGADLTFSNGVDGYERSVCSMLIVQAQTEFRVEDFRLKESSARTRLWLKSGSISPDVRPRAYRNDYSVRTTAATCSIRAESAVDVSHVEGANTTTCHVDSGGPVDIKGNLPSIAGMIVKDQTATITATAMTGSFFETVEPMSIGRRAQVFARVDTPAGVAVEPDGDVLVLHDTTGSVTRITPAGVASPLFTSTVFSGGWFGPLLRGDGSMVVGHGGTLYQISAGGARTSLATVPEVITGITLLADGAVAATTLSGKLLSISTAGAASDLMTGLQSPSHPAVGPDGQLYLVEGTPRRLARVNGAVLENITPLAHAPHTLANVTGLGLVLGQGDLTSYDASSMAVVNTTTGALTPLASPFSESMGAAGASGLFYVADPVEGCVVKFSTLAASTPALGVSTSRLDFGQVIVGTTSAAQTVTLTNHGTSNLSITAISTTSPRFIDSHPALPLSLAPGASAQVNITFQPTLLPLVTAALQITCNDPVRSSRSVRLEASGGTPAISVAEPHHADPGEIVMLVVADSGHDVSRMRLFVGTTEVQAFSYRREEGFELGTIAFEFPSGIPAGPVDIVLRVDGVNSAPYSYSAGLAAGPLLDFLHLGVPEVRFPPAPFNGSSTAPLVMKNRGNAALVITALTPGDAQFSVLGAALPMTILPGATGQVTLRFAPDESGGSNGSITVVSNDSASPSFFSLTGSTLQQDYAAAWRLRHFGDDADNPDISGPLADPDRDGLKNLAERAFGTDPNDPASTIATDLDVKIAGPGLVDYVVGMHRTDARDATIRILHSSDLQTWREIAAYTTTGGLLNHTLPHIEYQDQDTITAQVFYLKERLMLPHGATGRTFLRMQVDTQQPD